MYIRWSTEDQGEGTTLQVQREACEHYILSQGWQVNPDLVFVDEGYSGGSLTRPALTRLRQGVQAGAVDSVVVYKLDRLSRSVLDTVRLVLEEWDGRCCLRSAREAVDTASPSGKMLFYMLVSYAEWERGTIRERTLAGKLKRAESGRNPGFTPPFGYTSAPAGGFAVVPAEAAVVRAAFACSLAGLTTTATAARLNATGVRPRSGVPWNAGAVRRLLANPAYAGELQYGRRPRTTAGRRRRRGPPAVVCPGALPPLVTQAEWQAVAARLARRQDGGTRGQHLLTGVGRCACGAPLRVRARQGGAVYTCGGRGKAPGATHTPALPVAALDSLVLGALWRQFAAALTAAAPHPAADAAPDRLWQRLTLVQRRTVLRLLATQVVLAGTGQGGECAITWCDGPLRTASRK